MARSMQNSGEPISKQRADQIISRVEGRGEAVGAILGMAYDSVEGSPGAQTIAYRYFKERHPDYKPEYWHQLKALYSGGEKLLRDDHLMNNLFPQHRQEHPQIYAERKKRAYYVPYGGEVINEIVSGLFTQDIEMKLGDKDELPEYYQGFFSDVSPQGGKRVPLNDLLAMLLIKAMVCRRAWVLTELPSSSTQDFSDLAEQENAGALDAYAVEVEPEQVLDWEKDDSGELIWVLIGKEIRKRETFGSSRKWVTERFTIYSREGWQRFEIAYDETKKPKGPDDSDPVTLVAEGAHTFGHVPLMCLEMPDAFWIMDKIESLCRAIFNEGSALNWAVFQSLFPELYEFVSDLEFGQEGELVYAARRGQGHAQARHKDSRAEFIGPDSDPFKFTLDDLEYKCKEIHRVVWQTALAADPTRGVNRQSGESKRESRVSFKVILEKLGEIIRQFSEDFAKRVSKGRGDTSLVDQWHAVGMEVFEISDEEKVVESGVKVSTLEIPSPTFHRRHARKIAFSVLGNDATDEDRRAIEEELEENIPDEMPDDDVDAIEPGEVDAEARRQAADQYYEDDDESLGPRRTTMRPMR